MLSTLLVIAFVVAVAGGIAYGLVRLSKYARKD